MTASVLPSLPTKSRRWKRSKLSYIHVILSLNSRADLLCGGVRRVGQQPGGRMDGGGEAKYKTGKRLTVGWLVVY